MYEKRGTTEFYYYYDSFGNLAGIKYYLDGTQYMVYAICNTRGDVVDLYWGSGNLVCHYTYDSWGNVISVTNADGQEITNQNNIGNLNPIRYRGYYYDTEIGMYYLQSRYYNPQVGRFLNEDGYISTGQAVLDYNMFAYCGNNPVNNVDSLGTCYYASGQWCHDNWEFIGGYVRKPAPVDLTEKINKAMKENADTLRNYKDEHNYKDTLTFFVNKVKPGGDWDFKSQKDWALDSNTTYAYNFTELRYDDIGNIHYGYVGRVLFSSDILLLAGGAVQIYTGTSKLSYWRTNFDDPRDQWAIEYGCQLWDMG